ncbi:hypothetical protein Tco_0918142 [Tanacetum coccineum]
MLSKRPTFSTKDLHKSALGHRNPMYLKLAQWCNPALYLGDVIVDPVHTPFRVYDSEETIVQAKVSRTKMLERMKDPLCKMSSKLINYAKLNSLYDTFVPQKQLSSEQVYWLPANEVASYNCNQSKPITTFVRTRPAKSQVNTQLKMLKACFPEFDKKSLEIENKNLLIQNECLLAESVSKDICSVVLTSDIVVPMSVEPRSNCVKEHSRNLELEAEILKVKQLLVEKEKRFERSGINGKKSYTNKEMFDSIKTIRAKNIEHTTSLIANNDKFKAQLQEKGFAIAALKNELRKLTGNSVNTKFAKSSILGKPALQPRRNQSVVRQPTAFKSERPSLSKQRFASQVDVNNDLSKPVTTHYLPKGKESACAKPHHMIAPGSSRYSSNDMVHNHYLEEAKKKTQESSRNSEPSVIPSARSQSTTNGSKPKPRINNKNSRNWLASKSSCVTKKTVPIAEHSRNSRNFSDSKHFVCSTCQKCVFNANHDHCVTKFLNEVNSRAKVPSNKTTNRNKPVEQISVAKKPERQIQKGHRFSIKKTSVVHEKTMTPRSCLRWKPTGKIFKTVGLRWVPTGKIFNSSTTKVDSEPTNGSNEYITNQYECEQTLDVSAGTLNLSAGLRPNSIASRHNGAGPEINNFQSGRIGYGLVTTPTTPSVPPIEKNYLNYSNLCLMKSDVHPHLVNVAPPHAPEITPDSPSSTTVTEDARVATTITSPLQTSPPDTGVDEPEKTITTSGNESFENSVTNEFDSKASSSGTVNVNPT